MAHSSPDNTTANPTAPRPDAAPESRRTDQVLIRMYGQGLGDCFLLAFPRTPDPGAATEGTPERPVYVLVDCGVIGGTPGGPARMKAIVRDVKEATLDDAIRDDAGNPRGHLDLLIITHEHWDHVSGFVQAKEEWQHIQVDTLWTAWTEKDDPNGLPGVLKRILDKQRRAVDEIANRALRLGLSDRFDTVLGLRSFLSDAGADGRSFGAAAGTDDAWDAARALAASHTCCEPGEVRRLPGTEAIAYVLGPPRSDERLRQMNPSKRGQETYERAEADQGERATPTSSAPSRPEGAGFAHVDPAFSLGRVAAGRSAFNAFVMPLLGPALFGADGDPTAPGGLDLQAERDVYDRSFPFDSSVRVPLPMAETAAASQPAEYPALASYYDDLNHWRRIDFDWLASAEQFALRADSLTNNTGLVLAFELPAKAGAERKVLLFPGDAQVGSWLSWDEIPEWKPQPGVTGAQPKPDIPDLLKRTVFYKVGHHGSHNATLKARGVERMRDDGQLTAFVPVSPMVARGIKDWCRMPLDTLLNALHQRTGGRVVLANGLVWRPTDTDQPAPPESQAHARARIGLEVSTTELPPMVRVKDGQPIEGAVPLWVQIAIDY